jgi:hypothetical protein
MRFMTVSLGLALGVMAGSACSRQAVVESGPAARSQEITARGTVRRLGSEGAVRTVIQGERSVVVLGDYQEEIARVAGAEVWITGMPATSSYGPAIRASEYRILSVDGEVPVVGVLGEDAGGFFVTRDDGSVVRIDVSDRLATARGAKVWVVLGADRFTVTRYGILRD